MSSSGGCDPNISLAGMLKSSMKVISFLPPIGTYTPFVLFSTRLSMMSWTLFDVVYKIIINSNRIKAVIVRKEGNALFNDAHFI